MEGLKDSMTEYAQEGGPRARQHSYRYPKPLPAILGLISAAAGFALAAHRPLARVLANWPGVLKLGCFFCKASTVVAAVTRSVACYWPGYPRRLNICQVPRVRKHV